MLITKTIFAPNQSLADTGRLSEMLGTLISCHLFAPRFGHHHHVRRGKFVNKYKVKQTCTESLALLVMPIHTDCVSSKDPH